MSNRSSSKQHGLNNIKVLQPKSKLRKRRNKALANGRKMELRKITRVGLAKLEKVNLAKADKKNPAKRKTLVTKELKAA